MKKITLKLLALFFPIQLLLIYILKQNPFWVEEFYSRKVFLFVSQVQHYLTSWIPFSIGDLFYSALVLIILFWIINLFRRKPTSNYRTGRFRKLRTRFLEAVAFLSLLYFLFHLFWGFNYYRLPLHQSLGISTYYTKEELHEFACDLIQKTNTLHSELVSHDSLKVEFEFTQNQLQQSVFEAYKRSENEDLQMPYRVENVKKSLFSLPLSYAGFSGYVNPFTNEAQYNYKIPKYKLPTTIAHEIGHQLGFSKENEANFIAAIITMEDENQFLRYSGLTFSLKYSLNDMYRKDPLLSEALIEELNPGVMKNYKEVQEFWQAYSGPVELIMETVYGNYLKVNNQPQGIESYNYVVALLVNYYQQKQTVKH
ncbi:DUF3810 domain-containing protein [Psychroflexus sp. CAK8W]|uniref:DUF3810 domain-containing protein n=1 Tax=Psychroflexus longus TaxID=2873596 RepID=A0ABS7XK06_9FLAO|nr:DUF3810 domain-containing protein [Psychroflexus longus]MBZ9778839.1 DUF3810 domain-containing protein [Psychroflexus longus]